MKYIYSTLVLLLALFLAAFIQQNGQAISLRYFAWSTPSLPLSLYVIAAFAAGYLLAVIVGFSSGIRFRVRTAGAEREARKLRSELEEARGEKTEAAAGKATSGSTSDPPAAMPETRAESTLLKGVSADELRQALQDEPAPAAAADREEDS